VAAVEESAEQANGGCLFGQEPSRRLERAVGADAEAAAFVGGCPEAEQQLGGGVVQRGKRGPSQLTRSLLTRVSMTRSTLLSAIPR
jgi:hypothetical protein